MVAGEPLRGIKAVIFDLDETLLDAQEGLAAAHDAVIDRICEYCSFEEVDCSQVKLVKNFSEFDDRMNSERLYDRDKWWSGFLDKVGLEVDLTKSQRKELTRTYWKTYADNANPYPDSKDLLKYLKGRGYLLGMITDTDGPGVDKRDRISDLDISKFFDVIVVGGDDTKDSKPSKAPFELAASEMGVDPEECLMVGDKPFTDIEGANSVGMKTVLIKRREWDGGKDPDFKVGNLSEIKDLL